MVKITVLYNLLYVTAALHIRTWNLNPSEFQGFVIKSMGWKPAPTIMGLGHIQDQKVHISSAGLYVAKSLMRTADLARSLFFQLEILWQQLTFWGVGFFGWFGFFLIYLCEMQTWALHSCKKSYKSVTVSLTKTSLRSSWLSGEVFQSCTCTVMHIQARGFHILRMKLSEMQVPMRLLTSASVTTVMQGVCRYCDFLEPFLPGGGCWKQHSYSTAVSRLMPSANTCRPCH